MREILFRGKSKEKSEWVYGCLLSGNAICGPSISVTLEGMRRARHFVHENTIGQFTGLTEANGKKIFEGDIVHDTFQNHYGVVCFGDYAGPMNADKFTHRMGFYVEWVKGRSKEFQRQDLGFWFLEQGYTKVIGNIHDNPDLLP